MSALTDKDYFERRAEAEIEAAQASSHAAAVRAHYELAGHYLDLVHNPDQAAPASDGGLPALHLIGGPPRR